MSKSYEERMAEKYNFLKKDKNTSSEVTNKNTEHDEQVSNDEVIDVEGQEDSLLVPLDAWNTVLNQLGNLHEASQQMAEARERAAKAATEAIAGALPGLIESAMPKMPEVTGGAVPGVGGMGGSVGGGIPGF